MALSNSVEQALMELYKNAPLGSSDHEMPEYNQKDVVDTVNFHHFRSPEKFSDANIYYTGKASFTITKK